MFKRICAVVLSLSLFVTPSFAWSWESFVGKDNLPGAADPVYDLEPVLFSSRPMMLAANDGVALAADSADLKSFSFSDLFPLLTPPASSAVLCEVYHPGTTVAGITVPSYTEYRSFPESGFSFEPVSSQYSFFWRTSAFVVPDTLNSGEVTYFRGVCFPPYSSDYPNRDASFSLDISSFGSFSSFSLTGRLRCRISLLTSGSSMIPDSRSDCSFSLYVNDALVRTFYPESDGYVEFGSYIYDSSVPITSIRFSFSPISIPSVGYLSDSIRVGIVIPSDVTMNLSVLSGTLGKPSGMDSADSALNDYQQQEGEYFEGANNAIGDLDTSQPQVVFQATQLLGGLFNDLWTVLGDVKLLYFTPLLVGFFLWAIGKVRH